MDGLAGRLSVRVADDDSVELHDWVVLVDGLAPTESETVGDSDSVLEYDAVLDVDGLVTRSGPAIESEPVEESVTEPVVETVELVDGLAPRLSEAVSVSDWVGVKEMVDVVDGDANSESVLVAEGE